MSYYSEIVAGCFVAEKRATILDNPNLDWNDPDTWEAVFQDQLGTDARIPVTPIKALQYAPVYQAVNLISGDVARLPVMVYRVRWKGDLKYLDAQPDHSVTYRCSVAPNDEETAVDFWSRVLVHALIWSNAYIYITDGGELLTLLPDRTTPARTKDGELYYVTEVDGKAQPIVADQIMHIRGLRIDGSRECELVRLARNSWALGLAQERFASKFFANGGRIGGILELPSGMPKPTRDTLEEGFRKSYEGSENPFKTVVLRDNAKFHAAQQSPEQAQLVDASEGQVRAVARWFNLPPAKLGLKDATAYNATEQANQAYLDQCLAIWLQRIAAQIHRKLLSVREQAMYEVKHVTDELLKMDPQKLMTMLVTAVGQKPLMTRNEARAQLRMLPIDGGDMLDEPQATPEPVPPADTTPSQPTEPAAPPAPQRSEPSNDELLQRRALFHLTARARHKAKDPKAFLQWVDSKFKSHREEWQSTTTTTEPEFFVRFHGEMSKLAETTTADALVSAVDSIATSYERSV